MAIHKFKQTLSQKFKQSLKNPKNSANRPQAHHKKFQWIATNLHAYALQILAMTNSLSYWAFGEVSTCKALLCGKKHNIKSLFGDKNPTNAFDFKKCLFVNTTEFDFA